MILSNFTFSGWNDFPLENSRIVHQCTRSFQQVEPSVLVWLPYTFAMIFMRTSTVFQPFSCAWISFWKTAVQFLHTCLCIQTSCLCNKVDVNRSSESTATVLWYFTDIKTYLILTSVSSNIKILNRWNCGGFPNTIKCAGTHIRQWGLPPLILHLDTSWRLEISFSLWPLCPREEAPVPTDWPPRAAWVPYAIMEKK